MRQHRIFRGAIAFVLGSVLVSLPAAAVPGDMADYPPAGKLTYAVIRNGDQIGTHEMEFIRDANRYRVVTRVNIAVTVLGITYFRFVTDSDEVWVDGRFDSFEAKTNDDGKLHDLRIKSQGDSLEVIDNHVRKIVPGDLVPGTLWNPASLKATQLIDPTNGKPKEIQVIDRGPEQIMVLGKTTTARHISFTGKILREVWYGPDGKIVYMEYSGPDGSLVISQLR